VLTALLTFLLVASIVYCLMIVVAALSYLRQRKHRGSYEPISILKPLSGIDDGLEQNLRSFFKQRYPAFEILFAVRHSNDPAVAVVEKLQEEFPSVQSRLVVTGEPSYPNAKVYSLDCMLGEARHDLLVMSDSDIRVGRGFLESIAGEFKDGRIAIATCPYRAVAGRSLWSRLEAVGMNTEFLGGLLVARMLEGVRFAVGPTIVARRHALQGIDGFDRLKDYLAEDFVMGRFAADAGYGVILSRTIVEHRIGSESFLANASHRLRWARSTRRSRPGGYVGQVFTNPLPLALLLCGLHPAWWPILAPTLIARAIAAWAASGWVLQKNIPWHWLPLQDILSFGFWVAGFFGNTITWRGRRYYLHPDGRFEPT
jgi:ceramide glucosyltransferase